MIALLSLLAFVAPFAIIAFLLTLWVSHEMDKGSKVGKWFKEFFSQVSGMKLYYADGVSDVTPWITYSNLHMKHYKELQLVGKSLMEPEEIEQYKASGNFDTAVSQLLLEVVSLNRINRYSGIGQFIEEFLTAYDKPLEGYGTVVLPHEVLVAVNTRVRDWFPYFLGFEDTQVFEAYAKTKGITISYDPLEES